MCASVFGSVTWRLFEVEGYKCCASVELTCISTQTKHKLASPLEDLAPNVTLSVVLGTTVQMYCTIVPVASLLFMSKVHGWSGVMSLIVPSADSVTVTLVGFVLKAFTPATGAAEALKSTVATLTSRAVLVVALVPGFGEGARACSQHIRVGNRGPSGIAIRARSTRLQYSRQLGPQE